MKPHISDFRGYQGSIHLKRFGVNVDWTPEMVEEYTKCAEDHWYFIKKYVYITTADGDELLLSNPYPYQVNIIDSIVNNREVIVATARQAGKTTSYCAYILWYILFHKRRNVALLANKAETAREILGRIQYAYEKVPHWMQQGIVEWNKGSIELENGSRVLAGATTKDSFRGFSISVMFIDEAAHVENWDEFYTSAYNTLSSGKKTKIVLVSTPNGLNHFWKTWDLALQQKNEFKYIKVGWWDVPGRDENWKQRTLAAMNFDTQKFAQDHEVEFQGSSGTLIAGWKLKELHAQIPIVEKDKLTMYAKPIKGHNYILVADTSRGKGLDYSAFQVIDVTTMPYIQVCTYNNNLITPIDYADIVFQIANHYNKAGVLVENNEIGMQVADTIYDDYEYEHLLSTENAGRQGKRISQGFGGSSERGIRTTKTVKAVGCSILKLLIEQNQLVINDNDTIEQLSRFSKKGKSFEAESGWNDDLVVGLFLFGWLSDQGYLREINDINTLAKLRDKTEEQMFNELMPFGVVDDHHHYEEDLAALNNTAPIPRHWMDESY